MCATSPLSLAPDLKCELAVELLRCFGTLRLRATGRSMVPTIWPGDKLVIEPLRGGSVVPGDIVFFSRNGRFVAHRVVAADKEKIHTQGDATSRADAPVAYAELVGKVSLIVRDGKAIEPSRSQSAAGRVVSSLISGSAVAARIFVGVHGMRRRSAPEQVQQSNTHRVSSCQK